jgi:Flp pilus assembly protein TadG
MVRLLRPLKRDKRGATLPEFAIILPTFMLLLFGIFDIGQAIYAQSVLQGAMQDAGRDAGLESGLNQMSTIDQYVRDQTRPVVFANPTYSLTRSNYKTFSDVDRPEDYTDSNNNGTYDSTECFWDENSTGEWENDVARDGVGAANDVSVYTATIEYERVFPLWTLIGLSDKSSISAKTTFRNQPFGPQAARPKKQICPKK